MIGQLPKEAGGNYTTGAAKVVYELSKQHVDGIKMFTYATNASEQSVMSHCKYSNQYIGYKKIVWPILKDILLHPLNTYREWKHYISVDHESPLRYVFYKANIQRAIELVKPDIVHVHSIGNVSVTWFAIGDRKIPLLLTCHGIFYRGENNDAIGRDRYMGNLPLCDYYTGLTEESHHEFTDILGIPVEKYTIIPNGVDSSKFYYSEEWRKKIRMELNVGENCFVFLTVASLQERKGQLAFIIILEQLGIDYQYWMIGNGPDKERIDSYVNEHCLQNKIKQLGYHNSDDLYRYYSAADIYAHPSWKEGQALSEIEAYSCGLRIIVNKMISDTVIGDVEVEKENYYVVDFNNVCKEDIVSWIKRPSGERISKKQFDWQAIANAYAKVYELAVK